MDEHEEKFFFSLYVDMATRNDGIQYKSGVSMNRKHDSQAIFPILMAKTAKLNFVTTGTDGKVRLYAVGCFTCLPSALQSLLPAYHILIHRSNWRRERMNLAPFK